jgi:pimeloyl-ACP methyl ester carboxylesterase
VRLVALPGLGLRAEAWTPTLDRLPQASRVHLLPGYGEPAAPGVALDPGALGRDVLGILGDTGRVLLLGHSASCQVAAHVARLSPERIAGLVLVGPTTDPRAATWPRLARRWLATAVHEDPRQVPILLRHYRRTTLRTMRRGLEAARHDPVAEVLSGAGVPTLVVRGRHDRICPADWTTRLAGSAGPGSRAVTLPAGGHMVPLTHGDLLAPVVAAFLDAVRSGRGAGSGP